MIEEKVILRAGIKLFGFYYFIKGVTSLLGLIAYIYAARGIGGWVAHDKNVIVTVSFPILYLIFGIVLIKQGDFVIKRFFKNSMLKHTSDK